jgi:hypothetical protein
MNASPNSIKVDVPGPGAYEVNNSSFIIGKRVTNKSPNLNGNNTSSKKALNYSIPSIPSKYLMPNLDYENEI